MTVKELIQELLKMPQNAYVAISSCGRDNFSPDFLISTEKENDTVWLDVKAWDK